MLCFEYVLLNGEGLDFSWVQLQPEQAFLAGADRRINALIFCTIML